jgi:predicted thioredoxin/glutaredoxin
MVDDIRDALADARENAQELLTDHDDRLGRTISKNRFVAEMYESQLGKIASLIMKLSNL